MPIVTAAMPRNKFEQVKQYLHLANNQQLDATDKASKVRPLYDQLNLNLRQFGVFHQNLSVDEQMLPYFGKHSAKMFMRNKPVKFGYKFWVLASSNGYPYNVMLYTGKDSVKPSSDGLGSRVVQQLLQVVEDPHSHTVTFDNFFSSIDLLSSLKLKGFGATGTIRENRLKDCPLRKPASSKSCKAERGAYDYRGNGDVVVSLWQDNKPVYVASNIHGVKPVVSKRRYSGVQKRHIQVPCPK